MTLAERLQALRDELGLTDERIAEAVGVDIATVGQVLAGDIVRPPDERLRGFATVLNVSFESLRDLLPADLREATGAIVAAGPVKATKFRVRVIRAGLSHNHNYYPDTALREGAPLFDGVRVFVKSDIQHLRGEGKSFNNLIGQLSNPQFVPGNGTDSGEIQADLQLLEAAGEVTAKIREAYDRGMTDLFGFSIDAKATTRKVSGRAGPQRRAEKFREVASVDLIISPGAGGEIIQLLEAAAGDLTGDPDMQLREQILAALREAAPTVYARIDPENMTNDELIVAFREAVTPAADAGQGGAADTTGMTRVEAEELIAGVQRVAEARADARDQIVASGLPEAVQSRLIARVDDLGERIVEADASALITSEREYLGQFVESGQISGLGDGRRADVTDDRADKIVTMLDGFFDPDNRDVRSIRECYIEITGDTRVTGHMRDCDVGKLREAAGDEQWMREAVDSATFANVLGNSITRRMIADYLAPSRYDSWRQLATTTPVNDFRIQERTRYGGYGDLPAVAESGDYVELGSPTDEKSTYAVTKRGGLEKVTLEAIKNDDVGALSRIPAKLSTAAQRTLAKFVFDFIRTNPVIYDGAALFHASHNNLGAAALDAASLKAGRLAMLKQAELDSGDRLNIPPMHLWVSADEEETGFDLFRRQTNNESDFVESMQMQVHPVWYWTDPNDWALSADHREIPTIEIGFLDGNEEPELFIQDSPVNGSLFANDTITYKLRHTYGGNALDFRGLYKGVVP